MKRGDWVTFNDLSSNDKKFRVLNLILMFVILTTSISFLFYFISIGDPKNRIVATIGMGLFAIAPYLFEVISRKRINSILFLFYMVYLFLAGILGSVLNFYNTPIFKLNCWYDLFMHILMGYTFCFVGIFVLSRIETYGKLHMWTIILFSFSFTLSVELFWELLERCADLFLGQSAQGIKIEGYNQPLISDTMLDILCNLIGGIVFIVHYYLSKKTSYSLGIDFIENEIAYRKIEKGENVFIKNDNKYKVDKILLEEKKTYKKK